MRHIEHRQQRRHHVVALHEGIHNLALGAVRVAHIPHEPGVVGPQVAAALAEAPVVTDLRPVVREHQHDRVVPQAKLIELREDPSNLLVHEGDLALVERLGALDEGLGGLSALPCRAREDRVDLGRRRVLIGVLRGRVPRLMRVEHLHPEHERLAAVRGIEPLAGAGGDARAEVVVLALAADHVREVLREGRVLLPLDRLEDALAHLGLDQLGPHGLPVV